MDHWFRQSSYIIIFKMATIIYKRREHALKQPTGDLCPLTPPGTCCMISGRSCSVCSRGVTARAAPVDLDFFCSRLKTSVRTWSSAEQQLVLTIASGGWREEEREEEREERAGESIARTRLCICT